MFTDGSPPVPSTPVHPASMRDPFGSTTPIKTWTVDLANQDSDGDSFTNGEELQDPFGAWAIGKPDPGDVASVSNPSDSNPANDSYACSLSYRATPPTPLLLGIIGGASPASGGVSFGVSLQSALPVDFVRYTVKNSANQTIYDFFSASPPFRSGVWNTKAVPDGNYTVTAQMVEKRQLVGAMPRGSLHSEAIIVNNTSPSFGPAGEVIRTPVDPCGIPESLNGVATISPSDAWAVGSRFINGPGDQMVITHWDGVRWTSVISPNASTYFNTLQAVAASGTSDVWAVGSYDDGSLVRTLIEHWDGAHWKIAASPNPGVTNNRLSGVVALSANDAWAIGDYDDIGKVSLPLLLHWNGTNWNAVPFVSAANQTEITLKGIAAVSATDIWAVGAYNDGTSNNMRKTLILHWDGTGWNTVASPSPNTFVNGLNAVTTLAANDVWAVGYTSDGSGYKTLTLHWNGAIWQVVTSPSPGNPNTELLGVVAAAPADVWAVGYGGISADDGQTLALHWDGSSWQTIARPDGGKGTLKAVARLPSADVWAAGVATTNDPTQPLVERYRVTHPIRTSYLPLTVR
jgi:hypothetical protein